MTQSETYLGNHSNNLGSLYAHPLAIPCQYYKINKSSTFLRFLTCRSVGWFVRYKTRSKAMVQTADGMFLINLHGAARVTNISLHRICRIAWKTKLRSKRWHCTKQNKLNSLETKAQFRKILIISPGLIFVQKAFLLGLFSGELIFGGACYWKEFCVSKWVGLDNKNDLNTMKTT